MPVLSVESEKTFNNIIRANANNNQLIVIDFSATWCGPCKKIAPLYEKLSETMPNITFLKIDSDNLDVVSKQFNIRSLPTFVFIQNAKEISNTRISGANINAVYELCKKL